MRIELLIFTLILAMMSISLTFGQAIPVTSVTHSECTIIPEDSGIAEPLTTNTIQLISTSDGDNIFQCIFQIPERLRPAITMFRFGFDCSTYLGDTDASSAMSSPEGQVILTCSLMAEEE